MKQDSKINAGSVRRVALLPLILLAVLTSLPTYGDSSAVFAEKVRRLVLEQLRLEFSSSDSLLVEHLNIPPAVPEDWRSCRMQLQSKQRSGLLGHRVFQLRLLDKAGLVHSLVLSLQVSLLETVVVARRHIRFGETIAPDMLEMLPIEVSTRRALLFYDAQQLPGLSALVGIPQGRPLRMYMVGKTALIHRGDRVHLRLSRGGIRITAEAIVGSDGYAGESIGVTCLATGKKLTGIVQPDGSIHVN